MAYNKKNTPNPATVAKKRKLAKKKKRSATFAKNAEMKSKRDAKIKQRNIDSLAKKRSKAKKNKKYGKQARTQNEINKLSGNKKRHSKKSVQQKAKKNASWKKATTSAKKSGTSVSDLISRRKKLTKGSPAWKKVQNQINQHYGVKKRH